MNREHPDDTSWAPAFRRSTEDVAAPDGTPFGPYVKLRELGRGGFGTVWLAWDAALRRHVALKVLDGAADVERFKREARLAAGLVHPNIAAVHEVGEIDGAHYLSMQFVDGETLARRRLAPREAAAAIRDAARAVAHAHAQGIVHRDLKPANLMLEGDRLFVLDFGLAKAIGGDRAISMTGEILGTPHYMSPEQARGDAGAVGPRSDVWSLGATLYELVAGRRPFEGAAPHQVLLDVIDRDPPRPGVDRDLETIAFKCLEKEPARRYATAAGLADDLDRWLAGEPIAARPASILYRARKRLAKRKAVAVLATLLVVVTALLLRGGREDVRGTELYLEAQARLVGGLVAQRYGDTAPLERAVADVQSLADASDRAEAHFVKGWAYRLEGRWDEAIAQYDLYLADRDDAVAHYERGLCRLALYERDRAARVRAWREAEPDREPDLGPLAPRLDEAARDLAAAGDAHLALARGDAADARRRFAEGFADRETRPEILLGYVAATARLFDDRVLPIDDLLRAMDEVAAMNAGIDAALVLKARAADEWAHFILVREGRREEAFALWAAAERDATRAIEMWPHRGDDYAVRAAVRASIGDALAAVGRPEAAATLDAAAADADRAIEASAGSAESLRVRGLALTRRASAKAARGEDPRADFETAAADYRRARERDPELLHAYTKRADALYRFAVWLAARGEDPSAALHEAVAESDLAIARNGDLVDALNNRANARLRLSEWLARRGDDPTGLLEAAIGDYGRALARRPEEILAVNNRANAHVHLADWRAAHGGDPTEATLGAIADYDRVLAANPGLVDTHHNRASAWMALGTWKLERGRDPNAEFEAAVAGCDATIELNPRHADAHATRSAVWVKWAAVRDGDPREFYSRAIADASKALELNPEDPRGHGQRASAHYQMGEWRADHGEDPVEAFLAAIADSDLDLARNPRDAVSHNNRANSHLRLAEWEAAAGGDPAGRLEAAIAGYGRALAENPSFVQARRNRAAARLLLASRRADPAAAFEEAILDCDAAVAQNPEFVDAYLTRADARSSRGAWRVSRGEDPADDFEESVADYGRVLERNPDHVDAFNNRAATLYTRAARKMDLGADPMPDLEAAAGDFESAIRRRADLWRAHSNLGLVHAAAADVLARRGEPGARERLEAAIRAQEEAFRISRAEIVRKRLDAARGRLATLEDY